MSSSALAIASIAGLACVASTASSARAAESGLGVTLRDKVMRCWSPPPVAFGSGGPKVRVRFTLDRDGSLAGRPTASPADAATAESPDRRGYEAASAAAIRAVMRCSPYELPAAAYDDWRDVSIEFDQRGLGR